MKVAIIRPYVVGTLYGILVYHLRRDCCFVAPGRRAAQRTYDRLASNERVLTGRPIQVGICPTPIQIPESSGTISRKVG